ncbi:hypothetical protein VULLAG_LOCUS4229 [Vulpes lagopus]
MRQRTLNRLKIILKFVRQPASLLGNSSEQSDTKIEGQYTFL